MTDGGTLADSSAVSRLVDDRFWGAETLSFEALTQEVRAGAIDTVIIAGTDIQGKLFGKITTGELFVERLSGGIGVSCSTLMYDNDWAIRDGFPEIGAQNAWADMRLTPDLTTVRRWSHQPRCAVCLADAYWADRSPVEYLPRHILARQVARCRELGLLPICAAECEFYLFGDRHDEARAKNWSGLTRIEETTPDYSVFRPGFDAEILGAIRRQAVASGIPVETLKHEGGRGQYELSLTPCEAVAAADRVHLFKSLVKEVAEQHGMSATFMARQHHREAGSSGHVHQSVWDDQCARNLFVPEDATSAFSDLGRWWLGGQMTYAAELMPLYCPNVNSYKRLDADVFGPTTVSWGVDVRTAAFRAVGSDDGLNFENRIPGADANFYLAIAGMLASGLRGLEEQIEPIGEPERDSLDVHGEGLPSHLGSALDRFERSELARAAFGGKVVDHLVNDGRHELKVYDREVSDIERRRYFQWA